jgi:hypothetical protein
MAANGTNAANAKLCAAAKFADVSVPPPNILVSIRATVSVVPKVLAAVPNELNMAERMP